MKYIELFLMMAGEGEVQEGVDYVPKQVDEC